MPDNDWFQKHVVEQLNHLREDYQALGTRVDGFMTTQNDLNSKFNERLAVQGVKLAMFGFIGGGIGGAVSMFAVTFIMEYLNK